MWIDYFDGKRVKHLKNVEEIDVDLKEKRAFYGFEDDELWKVRELENLEWINVFRESEDEEGRDRDHQRET